MQGNYIDENYSNVFCEHQRREKWWECWRDEVLIIDLAFYL
jgi:hypothetical protein